jgi:hypothetical protein
MKKVIKTYHLIKGVSIRADRLPGQLWFDRAAAKIGVNPFLLRWCAKLIWWLSGSRKRFGIQTAPKPFPLRQKIMKHD